MFRSLIALIAASLSVAAVAADAPWTASDTKHFIIYSKSPPERVRDLAIDLERYDKLIRMATNIPDDRQSTKVRIYEVDGLKEIRDALGVDDNSTIAGFYTANSLGPFLVTPRKAGYVGEYFDAELVRHHEYAHHMMLQYYPVAYPQWY